MYNKRRRRIETELSVATGIVLMNGPGNHKVGFLLLYQYNRNAVIFILTNRMIKILSITA